MKKLFYSLITIVFLITITMPFLQEWLVFKSEALPQNQTFSSPKFNITELRLKANDGAILHGIKVSPPTPKGIVLYFHGNRGNVSTWLYWAEKMAEKTNHEILMMDYRGYGKSTGKRQIDAMLNDVSLFYDEAARYYSPDKIVIFGRSLGGAFASHCASRFSARMLVLESTFTSIATVVEHHAFGISVGKMLAFPFESISKVRVLKMPLYVIHGDADELIPYSMSQELINACPFSYKKRFTIPNGGHNDLHNRAEYWQAINKILNLN